MNENIIKATHQLRDFLLAKGGKIATAESCTGGLVSAAITHSSGSSKWFECGFVTYSNEAKNYMLGISLDDITKFGAVSEEIAKQMAIGALANSQAEYSTSITGIAGPSGGSIDKPVGTVCFAWAKKSGLVITERKLFAGDREGIRMQSAVHAILGCLRI